MRRQLKGRRETLRSVSVSVSVPEASHESSSLLSGGSSERCVRRSGTWRTQDALSSTSGAQTRSRRPTCSAPRPRPDAFPRLPERLRRSRVCSGRKASAAFPQTTPLDPSWVTEALVLVLLSLACFSSSVSSQPGERVFLNLGADPCPCERAGGRIL